MAHLGLLRDYRFSDNEDADIRGAHVYGRNDDKLGKIDDVIFDHASADIRYVVVDTSGWFSSKKFVVPSDRLSASPNHEGDFHVPLDEAEIEKFPPYNQNDVESAERWADYEGRYRSKWAGGPVMHREATDRNITPTTAQMTQGTGATGPMKGGAAAPGEAITPEQEKGLNPSRLVPPNGDGVQIEMSPTGVGSRWTSFADRLRERRQELTSNCVDCGHEPGRFSRKAS
jgi:sporulation protein YlmC with PRC-barrel domain